MQRSTVVVKAVIQNDDGRILVLRRSNTDTRRPLEWDLPGGEVEENEDFARGVSREIKEETNLTIPKDTLHLAYAMTAMRDFGNVCWLYFITFTREKDIHLSFEHDQYEWMEMEKALQVIAHEGQLAALQYIHNYQLLI